jgi:hypothetical protein
LTGRWVGRTDDRCQSANREIEQTTNNELHLKGTKMPNSSPEQDAIAAAYISQARQEYTSSKNDIEIDDAPNVSIGEGGAWVAAWVWVGQEEASLSAKGPLLPVKA